MITADIKNPPKSIQNFPVVGIGASAGGLDAFKKLLAAIPGDSGMAFVIVQHLSPDHHSSLTEILSAHSKIPVHEIISNINLAPNHVYIIPENNLLIAEDGVLKLKQRTRKERRNNTIDIFFESLADVHRTFAIGVILSGTGFDGTLGFKKIKELGGATIAQDPETAAFKGMPQSAIDTDAADYILAPEKIPSQLLEIQQSYITNYGYTEEEHIPTNDEAILLQIINLIFLRTGNDFRYYKQPTIRRRIARRMVIAERNTIEDYYNFLRNNKNEQDLLFNDFLIHVTYFFRDQEAFENLSKTVFPSLIKNITNNNLRIWVAGCSTGEEAYSLAICLHEYLLETNNKNIKVQIFASDISEKCITKARSAIYTYQDVQQISEERLHNYFTRSDGNYHINKVIRDMCIFAVHNFIKDPAFARIDLVSCRNVLIYFDPYLQNKVLGSFHYSLKDTGFLFLGKSESAINSQDLFESIEKHEKIYIRKFVPGRYEVKPYKPAQSNLQVKMKPSEIKTIPEDDFRKTASDILFTKYTPASVIINKNLEIVHFHGDTSPFLLPPQGKPNFNILKMAREGICFELQNAILKVKEEKLNIRKDNIQVKNQPYTISFEIVLLQSDDEYLMVLFYKIMLPEADSKKKLLEKKSEQKRIDELESELSQLRENIKRVTEEQQTAFEELQTSNEELLSSGEELQAMNEELETSTEELQSNNEELMCVNDELMDRQQQLISMRNYSESIVKTIREPLLIVDKDFIIKSANPAFYKYFSTTESVTEGYSLFEIGNCQWDIPEFRQQIVKIDNQFSIEDLKIDTICADIGKKTMIVNARRILNSTPEGMILLALEDITDLVTSNELLTAKNFELQKHNEQLEAFTSAASHDLQEPLRKINMFCKRIFEKEENLSESGKHNLERVIFSVSNMSQLIADLINYSRINFIEKEYKKTDLNLLLKKTLNDLKDTINEKDASISLSPLPQLNIIPYQIQQLFTNLITNSIKYTKEDDTPQIKIETDRPSTEEIIEIGGNPEINYAKICVADNGIGFNKDYETRIFEPFYRLHNNDQYSGSGLGLTLVKKIVANHHGFIRASSKQNLGTTMSIYIPL
ncbi:CheR family methyltransferase [Flavobacterium piscis]|uniref:Two-component system CheB/CheR fusion protein n=1 Tax=Flavobacterium piscis TaxID=1114874 RepID=A0ABU1Y3E5_9FLAO|nr:CheR family methyltransferase [Flavobacterium piscis]MDR7208742.1 two-component system CheB/CheR fusion protein [Flavobacterium piscis]